MAGPRYTDEELALILSRAATLEAARDESRHSLEDVQEIASQVGIAPALVADAAASLSSEPRPLSTAGNLLLGPRASFELSSRIQGSLDAHQLAEVLHRLRLETGMVGVTREVGGSIEWSASRSTRRLTVIITPGPRQTLIHIHADYRPL